MHKAIKQLNIKHKTPPPPYTNFQLTSYHKEKFNKSTTQQKQENQTHINVIITNSEVNSAIKSLKNNRSPGYDNIVAEMMKILSSPTIDKLTHIININISKIFEKLVLSRITSHVSSSPNFNPFQSAYRKHHSTETTLLRITDSLRIICATGHAAVLVLLDLSAAFDTLDHNILIDILNRHFSISDLALSWFCSYLSQRSQFVKMNNFSFFLTSLNSGISQGSVLEPILFIHHPCVALLYSTTYFFTSSLMTLLFTGASHPDSNPTLHKLFSCLSALNSWISQSQLKLNSTKCEVMFVGSFRISKIQSLFCGNPRRHHTSYIFQAQNLRCHFRFKFKLCSLYFSNNPIFQFSHPFHKTSTQILTFCHC